MKRAEAIQNLIKAAREWRASLQDDGWDEEQINSMARPGLGGLILALDDLDTEEGHPQRGETNSSAKLTETDARRIISLYRAGQLKQRDIASLYPAVGWRQIGKIVRGEKWKHLHHLIDR